MSKRRFTSMSIQLESDSDDDLLPSNMMATSVTSSSRHPNGSSTSMPTTVDPRGLSAPRASFRQTPNRFPSAVVASTTGTPTRASPRPGSSKPVTPVVSIVEKKRGPKLIGPQTMVTINVSLDAECEVESFYVHKNFITHYSPYFNAAFNGSFAEGQTQKMSLEDTEPHVFGTFVNWLYSQEIENVDGEVPEDSTLINLWLLADKCLVPKLQNQVIRALDKRAKDSVPRNVVVAEAARVEATCAAGAGIGLTRPRAYRDILMAAGGSVSQEILEATYARMIGPEAYRRETRVLQQHQARHQNSTSFDSSCQRASETPVAARAPAPVAPRVKQDPALFHRVYENTTKDSKLRAYFIDVCSKPNVEDIDEDEADDYPHDMLVDIINRMRRPNANKTKLVSEYYVNEDVPKRG